jgi:eukaryotic-like serine/threonine-protein kinase
MTNPFDHNPFAVNPFDRGSYGAQPAPAPPPARRDEVNTLATLSIVFAFVAAPAGAVLGHLGLSQIRRTGQRGRERALIGVTLSYVFITVAVVALIVGATLAGPARTAAPAGAPTSSTASTAASVPTVATAALAALLPTLDEVKTVAAAPKLGLSTTVTALPANLLPPDVVLDRPECWPAYAAGTKEAYDITAVRGFYLTDFQSPSQMLAVAEGVAAYSDAAAAQVALSRYKSSWQQCGGTTITSKLVSGSDAFPTEVGVPADSPSGVTTITLTAKDVLGFGRMYRAIAAKNNVLLDVWVSGTTQTPPDAAGAIADRILAKIPG